MKYTLIAFLTFVAIAAFSQTNTFPASGNPGIVTLDPTSYNHGGNNRALEIFNPNSTINSQ